MTGVGTVAVAAGGQEFVLRADLGDIAGAPALLIVD